MKAPCQTLHDAVAATTATYVLPPADAETTAPSAASGSLSEPVLHNSIRWFCRVRWSAIALLTGLYLVVRGGIIPGLAPTGAWPVMCAAALALGNLALLWHARRLGDASGGLEVRVNLWAQIVMDLLILTVVVYFVGSIETFVAMAYLFHVVLGCMFFPRRLSGLILLLSAALFSGIVTAEYAGVLPAQSLLGMAAPVAGHEAALDVVSAIVIWAAVWYLASHLADVVRRRDLALAETNRRLVAAQEERTRHMLVTTHQLKSPFAAIHAHAQLLLGGYCGPLSEPVMSVAQRITARCRRLTREIQEMLQLANLGSQSLDPPRPVPLDLSVLIRRCLDELDPIRQERGLQLDLDLRETICSGIEEHYVMLLGNLLSNAMTYSRPGGTVRVNCSPDAAAGCVTIADEGIGIAPQKLPKIFDAYYRTDEAVKHNLESSGLGLAIVKHVATLHGIAIRIESRVDAGSVFHLRFPRASNPAGRTNTRSGTWLMCS